MRPMPAQHVNRLAGETSPYLLQHAHNPVDWYPWGPEALARAQAQDRPIFLSVGYAACHWCHVMERESFEDPATAADLDRDFVAVKVDREERPDIDAVYMAAVQAMTGSGGWPMSVFLTPDGRPFYGGTYFPPERRHGLPSFRDVLAAVATAWRERRAAVEVSATELATALARAARAEAAAPSPADAARSPAIPALTVPSGFEPALLDRAVAALEAGFDPVHGGWGSAPKFPAPMTLEFLLRRAVGGDHRALRMARRTLDAMADGGIRDQLGGGFHRYATDATWLVPHFEKMLSDSAQLARVYLHAFQLTGERRYRAVAEEALAELAREMRTADGAFATSLDADTAGVEGATYTWTREEIVAALEAGGIAAESIALFLTAYGVTGVGNWEGRMILARSRSDAELAALEGLAEEEVGRRLGSARSALLARRAGRAQPARDDKVLAAWNGLAIGAFADAAAALGSREAAAIATEAAEAVLRHLRTPDGRLRRSFRGGRASGAGGLEDYTHLADGLLALYEATFDERWFTAARELADRVLRHFADPAGGFFDTPDDGERLFLRPRGFQDNALPSGNAMAATVLLRLHALTGDGRDRVAAEQAVALVLPHLDRFPGAFSQWLLALGGLLGPTVEIAIVGNPDEHDAAALVAAARRGFRPHQVLAVAPRPKGSAIELLQARFALGGRATAFVCRDFACRQPVTEAEALVAQLSGLPAP